jgi:tetratricopeptide (TPR) repeat protein
VINKGYIVVDRKQVASARADASIELMMKGKVPERITEMDADYLIVGKIDSTRLGQIEGTDFRIYVAGVKVSVIRIGTGQIIQSFVSEVRGDGISEKTAARRAQKKSGDKILKDILSLKDKLEAGGGRIELVVHGIPDPSKLGEVTGALEKLGQIKKVSVKYNSKRLTKLHLDSSAGPLRLSTAMHESSVPLDIVATSSSRMIARYDPAHALSLGMVVTNPVNRLGARYRWIDTVLPDVLAAEAQNVKFLDVEVAEEEKVKAVRGKVPPKEVKRISKAHGDAPLVAVLTAKPAGKKASVGLKIYEAVSGKAIFSAAASGDPDDLTPTVQKIAGNMSKKLLGSIARKKNLRKNRQLARVMGAARAAKAASTVGPKPSLKIASIRIDNLFPSRFGHYQENPVGKVVLKASKEKAPEEVKVSVFVPKFMSLPSETTIDKMEKGARVEVPVKLTMDSDKIFRVDENMPVQAEVKVRYQTKEGVAESKRVVPLIVFDRNAIDWSDDKSIASFVTFREESVKSFARKALAAGWNPEMPEGLHEAAVMFNALRQIKVKYLKDPTNPFGKRNLDYVQYPRETLGYKTGDCDDLAVLYSALLESVGVRTALITTPGHILVAFRLDQGGWGVDQVTHDPGRYLVLKTGVEKEGSRARGTTFRIDSKRDKSVLVRRATAGEIWIPVETTSLGGSFAEAWRRGAQEVNRWRRKPGKIAAIPTSTAWKEFPAVSLPQEIKKIPVDVAELESRLAKDSKEIKKHTKESYKKRLAALEKRTKKRRKDARIRNEYAVMLALGGNLEKAAGVLEEALELKQKDAGIVNNTANVKLLKGEFLEAVGLYKKALELDEALAGRIHSNVGLAHYTFGDLDKAKKAFAESARLGGEDLFVSMGLLAPREKEGTLAGDKKQRKREVIERDLAKLMTEVLEKKSEAVKKPKSAKKDLFSNPLPSGGRRGDDPGSKRRLADLLRWII